MQNKNTKNYNFEKWQKFCSPFSILTNTSFHLIGDKNQILNTECQPNIFFCCHFNLKRDEVRLAFSLFDIETTTKTLAGISCLVFGF